ncbi:hypothetical protein KFL_001200180 [Klebsormidium nitens]|uniref:Appr-1-p processing enzyme family protein n=1 Tax=Klebsormidium nitens TaxID=105231 RepID=A0A1Y1HVN6_KLENI|nr:hypothetical protein KFL_001200180 [Klebsormidium nitens]|eukprot:GAQ82694.1 hypothetical protein KFL_001200180 [Klebsormidium nitens]
MGSRYGGRPEQDFVVKLEQIPRWVDAETASNGPTEPGAGDGTDSRFLDPLSAAAAGAEGAGIHGEAREPSKFPVDQEANSRLYVWRGAPWPLEVDAVVNSTNETLDESRSVAGLHAAAGPGLADECETLNGCRVGEAKITSGYDLPARKVIHTVGPRYAPKYHTAAEGALSKCYRSCLELLIEQELRSIAMAPINNDSNYPREPGAHVAIRTVRRFLEKHKDKIDALVFCTMTTADTEIYKRLLPLYFPRDQAEEDAARSKLPADVGDENGGVEVRERKIRIGVLPGSGLTPSPSPSPRWQEGPTSFRGPGPSLDVRELVDPSFVSMARDPDVRRAEQMERAAQAANSWRRWGSLIGLGPPPLSPAEEDAQHARFLSRAMATNLQDLADMKILYRGGIDFEGRPIMVVVGAHFIPRSISLDRFILHCVKEFEPISQKPFSIVYIHSAVSYDQQPGITWLERLEQILGRKHRANLRHIYILHPTISLKAGLLLLQTFVQPEVWSKVIYIEHLGDLFRYVQKEQLSGIPDFVLQHDLEISGSKDAILSGAVKNRIRRSQEWLGDR